LDCDLVCTNHPQISCFILIALSWNLGASIIVTVGSRLADIFGRRWFLLFGAVAAAVGALVGATGQSINQMIISGIIFGVGGGFQEMCFACAQELVPHKHRFRTLGKPILFRKVLQPILTGEIRCHDHGKPLFILLTFDWVRFHHLHENRLASLLLVVLCLGGGHRYPSFLFLQPPIIRYQARR